MKIKVFTFNTNGKIEFTPAELERLLNDTYEEGQQNCNCNCGSNINYNDSTTANASTNDAQKTHTITATLNATDAKEMSKHIDEIIKSVTSKMDNDAFSKLARELNF